MSRRFVPLLLLLGLTVSPAPAPAADTDEAAPTLVLRVKSVDEVIAAASKFYGQFGNKDEAERQIGDALKGLLGPKGLDGIDPKRPIGLYAVIKDNPFFSDVVVEVPVTGGKDFLDLLERVHAKAEKAQGDVYRFQPPGSPFPAFLRFADKYAYITLRDASAIAADKVLSPSALMPAVEKALVAVLFRIDRVPATLKQQALAAMDQNLARQLQEKEPGESDAHFAFRKAAGAKLDQQVKEFFEGGREVALRVDDKLGLDFTMTSKPGSALARDFAALGQTQSRFAALRARDAALGLATTCHLPEDLRQTLGPVIDEAVRKGLEKEQDAIKRDLAAGLARALEPTLKAGTLDLGVALHKPAGSEHATLVAGLAVKDGEAIDRAVRDLVQKLPEEKRGKIHLDAETAGSAKIHRLDDELLNSDNAKENEHRHKVFGKGPAYVAVGPDAVVFGMGPNSLVQVKHALAAKAAPSPSFRLSISLPEFGELVAADNPQAAEITKKLGKFTATVEGGESLKIHIDGVGIIFFTARRAVQRSYR